MFTNEMIVAAQAKVKSGADYPGLVQELKAMGVRNYVHLVADGSNIFHGDAGHVVKIRHGQKPIPVAEPASAEKLRHSLLIHQQGKSDYPTFCREAGEAGIATWTSDLEAMTVTYSDRAGKAILVEVIPAAK